MLGLKWHPFLLVMSQIKVEAWIYNYITISAELQNYPILTKVMTAFHIQKKYQRHDANIWAAQSNITKYMFTSCTEVKVPT